MTNAQHSTARAISTAFRLVPLLSLYNEGAGRAACLLYNYAALTGSLRVLAFSSSR